jgi:hypothetical protein
MNRSLRRSSLLLNPRLGLRQLCTPLSRSCGKLVGCTHLRPRAGDVSGPRLRFLRSHRDEKLGVCGGNRRKTSLEPEAKRTFRAREAKIRHTLKGVVPKLKPSGTALNALKKRPHVLEENQQCEVVFGSTGRLPDTRGALAGSLVECLKQLPFQ